MPPDYWKIGKKQHFICSNLTLFIAPHSFFFLFFIFFSLFRSFSLSFFFFSYFFGEGDGPISPLKWRPWQQCCSDDACTESKQLILTVMVLPLTLWSLSGHVTLYCYSSATQLRNKQWVTIAWRTLRKSWHGWRYIGWKSMTFMESCARIGVDTIVIRLARRLQNIWILLQTAMEVLMTLVYSLLLLLLLCWSMARWDICHSKNIFQPIWGPDAIWLKGETVLDTSSNVEYFEMIKSIMSVSEFSVCVARRIFHSHKLVSI